MRTVAGGGKAHEGGNADCVDYETSAMDGIGTDARFNYPWGIEFDSEENVLYVADCVSVSISKGIGGALGQSSTKCSKVWS